MYIVIYFEQSGQIFLLLLEIKLRQSLQIGKEGIPILKIDETLIGLQEYTT